MRKILLMRLKLRIEKIIYRSLEMKNKKELEIEIENDIKDIIKKLFSITENLYQYDDILKSIDENRFYDNYQFNKSFDELYLSFQEMIK